jgi:hypothetical protein
MIATLLYAVVPSEFEKRPYDSILHSDEELDLVRLNQTVDVVVLIT